MIYSFAVEQFSILSSCGKKILYEWSLHMKFMKKSIWKILFITRTFKMRFYCLQNDYYLNKRIVDTVVVSDKTCSRQNVITQVTIRDTKLSTVKQRRYVIKVDLLNAGTR